MTLIVERWFLLEFRFSVEFAKVEDFALCEFSGFRCDIYEFFAIFDRHSTHCTLEPGSSTFNEADKKLSRCKAWRACCETERAI